MGVFQPNELEKFVELSNMLHKRPGMFVETVSLENIYNFLSGYAFYLVHNQDGKEFFFNSFSEWLARVENTRYCPSFSALDYIRQKFDTEELRLNCFFNYLGEYIRQI